MSKIYFPALPLQEKVAGDGGLTRDAALAAALANVRAMSDEGDRCIEDAIQSLENIVTSATQGRLTTNQMRFVLDQSDQVINMAGTFGYDSLERTCRNLCDIVDGMLGDGHDEVAPVSVHVRAMRLFAPTCTLPPVEASAQVVAELSRVTDFYNYVPLANQ